MVSRLFSQSEIMCFFPWKSFIWRLGNDFELEGESKRVLLAEDSFRVVYGFLPNVDHHQTAPSNCDTCLLWRSTNLHPCEQNRQSRPLYQLPLCEMEKPRHILIEVPWGELETKFHKGKGKENGRKRKPICSFILGQHRVFDTLFIVVPFGPSFPFSAVFHGCFF